MTERKKETKKTGVFNTVNDRIEKLKAQRSQAKAENTAQQEHLENVAEKDEALAGRMLFEKLYDNRQKQFKYLLIAVVVLSIGLVSAFFGLYKLSYSAKVLPYIVRIDGNNQILNIDQAKATDFSGMKPYFATYLLQDFVRYAREVQIDGVQERAALNKAYAMTQGAAASLLKETMAQRSPYQMVSKLHETIDVQINNVIPELNGDDNATQIIWTEVTRDANTAEVISTKQYRGIFHFKWKGASTEAEVKQFNPLGFYITHIAWSEIYEG